MSVMRGNVGNGGMVGTAQTGGDTHGTARGVITAAPPGGGGPEFQFNDPVNSQNAGIMG